MIGSSRKILVSIVLSGCSASALAQQLPAPDTSPHRIQLVSVAEGVELEVLDWSGSGRPLVLLAGLGPTAHTYDAIAPKLSQHFRVYGITRRGFGASSKPATGYTVPRLVADIVAVLDKLKLDRPLVVGHSVAGMELDELGAKHGNRISGLIYLDAAGDRTESVPEEYKSLLRVVAPNSPAAQVQDRKKPDSMEGLPPSEQIYFSTQKPDYAMITVPALAFVAVPREARVMWLNYDSASPETKKAMDRMHEMNVENIHRQKKQFDKGMADGESIAIVGARHDIYRSHEADVLKGIIDFSTRKLR